MKQPDKPLKRGLGLARTGAQAERLHGPGPTVIVRTPSPAELARPRARRDAGQHKADEERSPHARNPTSLTETSQAAFESFDPQNNPYRPAMKSSCRRGAVSLQVPCA